MVIYLKLTSAAEVIFDSNYLTMVLTNTSFFSRHVCTMLAIFALANAWSTPTGNSESENGIGKCMILSRLQGGPGTYSSGQFLHLHLMPLRAMTLINSYYGHKFPAEDSSSYYKTKINGVKFDTGSIPPFCPSITDWSSLSYISISSDHPPPPLNPPPNHFPGNK